MKRHLPVGIFAASLLLSGASFARADLIQNLASIISAGGSITAGNASYSNFILDSSTIPAADILVDISGSAGVSAITFTAPPSGWAAGAINDATQIQFQVDFAVPVTSVGLNFAATGDAASVASVGETVIDNLTSDLYSSSVLTDGAGPRTDTLSDSIPLLPPSTSLSILKSIDIAGTGSANITSVTNTYSTPEPASLSLLSLGLLSLLRRRSHK